MNIETDEVLVNRNSTTYTTTVEQMAELQDNDLMLVNRDSTTYKVTGKEIKDSIVKEIAPNINSVLLSQNQVTADRYTSNNFTSTVNYSQDPFPPASVEMTAKVTGALGLEAATSPIVQNSYPGTASDEVELELSTNTFLDDGTFEVGDVVKANESYTPTSSELVSAGAPTPRVYAYINGVQDGSALTYKGGNDYVWKDYEGYTTLEMPNSNQGNYGHKRELTFATIVDTSGQAAWAEFWYYDDGLSEPFKANSWPVSTNFHYGYASATQFVHLGAYIEANLHAKISSASKGWHHIGYEMNAAHTEITSYFDGELTNVISCSWNTPSRQTIQYWNADYSGQTTIAPVAGIRLNVGDETSAIPYTTVGNKFTPVPLTAPFAEATAGVTHYIPVGAPTAVVLELQDDTDIKLFQEGDVVQSDKEWDQEKIWSSVWTFGSALQNVDKATDGVLPANLTSSVSLYNNFQAPIEDRLVTFDRTYPAGTKLEFWSSSSNSVPNAGRITLLNSSGSLSSDDVLVTGAYTDTNWFTIVSTAETTGFTVVDASPGSTQGVQISGIKIEDRLMVDTGIAGSPGSETKIISTDVSAKTITVDGGTWDMTNRNQVWSDDLSGVDPNQGFPATNLFDGNTVTTAEAVAGGSLTFLPAGGIAYTQKVECWIQSGAGGRNFSLNDGPDVPNLGSEWTVVATGSGTLNKLVCQADSGRATSWSAIRVDGKILIDAGNTSEIWSNRASVTQGELLSTSITNLFNGGISNDSSDPDAYIEFKKLGGNGEITFSPPLTSNSGEAIKVYIGNSGSGFGGDAIWVNGSVVETPVPGNGSPPLLFNTGVSTLNSLRVEASKDYRFIAIVMDDEQLVDTNSNYYGDTFVSTVKPKQGEGTISDISGTNVTIEPFTDNCFKEGQYLIHATPKTILITPQSDQINTVASDVLFLDGSKDLLNFSVGDPVTMVNADGSTAAYPAVTDSITGVGGVTGTIQIANSGTGNPVMFAIYLDDGTEVLGPSDSYINSNFGTQSYNNNNYNSDSNKLGNRGLYYTSMDNRFTYSGFAAGTEVMIVFGSAGSPGTQIRVSGDVEQNIEQNFDTQPKESNPKDFVIFKVSKESGNLNIGGTNIFIHYIDFFVNSPPVTATVLEFASDQNLQYYNVGDVVQGGQYRIEQPAGTPTTDASIQNLFTSAGYSVSGRNTGNTVFYFDPPIPVNNTITFEANSNGDYGTLTCFDENDVSIGSGSGGSYQFAERTITVPGLKYLRKITTTNGSIPSGDNPFNNTYRNFKIDGNFITVIDLNTLDYSIEVTNISDIANNKLTVAGGSWNNGDTITKDISGTGNILESNPQTNTITLTNSNDEWVAGYYVQTPEKPAIAQNGYLIFGSNGNVTGVTLTPQPAVIMAEANPILKFPALFGTGQTPDTELPYPTSLQTVITAKNTFVNGQVNSSTVSSNVLYPSASTYVAPASGTRSYTTAGVAQLGANLQTFSGRAAAANTDPTDVQGAFTAAQTDINNYIAGL